MNVKKSAKNQAIEDMKKYFGKPDIQTIWGPEVWFYSPIKLICKEVTRLNRELGINLYNDRV